jgi:hypothetical protein
MRPPTHDDPHAIPRNGTDVPWLDTPDSRAGEPGSWDAPPAPEARQDRRSRRDAPGRPAQRGM